RHDRDYASGHDHVLERHYIVAFGVARCCHAFIAFMLDRSSPHPMLDKGHGGWGRRFAGPQKYRIPPAKALTNLNFYPRRHVFQMGPQFEQGTQHRHTQTKKLIAARCGDALRYCTSCTSCTNCPSGTVPGGQAELSRVALTPSKIPKTPKWGLKFSLT